jgi:hypothetical protein
MVSIELCWKFKILALRALVLLIGKNLARNTVEHFSHILTAYFSL